MAVPFAWNPPPPDTHLQNLLLTHMGILVGEWEWEELAED